ncbi:DUF6279 family lipoprotein [Marinobacter orientalis]|uniref:DUF3549 domain-containing protein n=1 Tax=Marinobacter orientalis TaxID=1928859 RepID=A0A7Y0RDG5_9GAMM|nr:DUF6279 family lipoprotein [Marinobacter orientalis]NMT64204.1 DUF3549 domain-containing protein [Marinobacter orientalis]TGX49429.1 DUF3549 domain-containing protein [Marinobacter orientalis]
MLRPVCIALIGLLLLAGCSSTKLAYRYADWGIIWWVDDYIPMTAEQESRLEQDIRELRQWHCSTELPLYSRWLTQLHSDVHAGDLDQATVAGHQETLFSFFQPLVNRAKPAATRLLASLSDDQVQQLAANMEDSQEELEAEFLADSPEKTRAARAERTIERIERWLGSLNKRQRETVSAWSGARGEQTEIWLEGRRNWQQALLEALKERRDSDSFADRISYLIDNNEAVRGKRYQQMISESRTALSELMTELLQQADQRHLDHLAERAAELERDFDTLACASEDTESGNG